MGNGKRQYSKAVIAQAERDFTGSTGIVCCYESDTGTWFIEVFGKMEPVTQELSVELDSYLTWAQEAFETKTLTLVQECRLKIFRHGLERIWAGQNGTQETGGGALSRIEALLTRIAVALEKRPQGVTIRQIQDALAEDEAIAILSQRPLSGD